MVFIQCFKLHYWPPLTCAWFIITFAITFAVSVLQNHVYIYFPLISDTGTTPPESCIFGQMLNIGAVFFMITMYIRYRQVGFALNFAEGTISKKWNTAGCCCGFLVSLGISIVGNFQETLILPVHIIGAGLTFGVGTIYLFIQTVISYSFRHIYYKYPEYGVGPSLLYLRIFLTACSFVLFNSASISLIIALSQFKGDNIAWWTEEHGGFQARLVATFSEWILALVFVTFVLSLAREYKLMEYEEVRFKDKFQDNKEPENTKV